MLARHLRKKISEKFLYPIGRKLSINPNMITALTYVLSPIAGYFIFIKNYPIALVFVIISSLIDNIDGAIAKAQNKRTDFGSYFDAFSDRVQEFFILLGFFLSGYALESFLALAFSFLVSYAKARAEMIRPLGNIDWPSVGERAERLLVIILTLLVASFRHYIFKLDVISVGLYFLSFIAFTGTLQRFIFAKHVLEKK